LREIDGEARVIDERPISIIDQQRACVIAESGTPPQPWRDFGPTTCARHPPNSWPGLTFKCPQSGDQFMPRTQHR
jgi:hypothetical protein